MTAEEEKIPVGFKPFFWDVDWGELDRERHAVFIIERILNEGDHQAIRWLIKTYGREKVRLVVTTSKKITLKTARCWQNYFGLTEEEMRCFGRYWMSPDEYC